MTTNLHKDEHAWQPRRRIELAKVLRDGRLAGLELGALADRIEAELGAPQAPRVLGYIGQPHST